MKVQLFLNIESEVAENVAEDCRVVDTKLYVVQ